jgi:hypothetical protein
MNNILISTIVGGLLGYFSGLAVVSGVNKGRAYTLVPLIAFIVVAVCVFFADEKSGQDLNLKLGSSLGTALALSFYGLLAFGIGAGIGSSKSKKNKNDETDV